MRRPIDQEPGVHERWTAGHERFEQSSRNDAVDFDLHGLVGIRLVGASPGDAAGVARQLGPIMEPLQRPPDILVRFVDRLPAAASVRYLGWNDAGFTDEAFLVFRSRRGGAVRAQIDFARIGRGCEILCQSGLSGVPLLVPIVNLTLLAKGIIPVHASAFTHSGTGVLVTGWAKGGKTETLLGFMSRGAQYIGDEWVYLGPDGGRLYGIPEPMKVWDWHLEDLPQFRSVISRPERFRLRAMSVGDRVERALARGAGRPSTAEGRTMSLMARRRFVRVPPARLFGTTSCVLTGSLDKIFLVVSHESSQVSIEPADAQEIARRIVFSLQHERLDFLSYYYKFRFAFPEAANPHIDEAEGTQLQGLLRAFAGKEAYVVYHPYPAPILRMVDAMAPFID
jgi:hypothetical protein